jgi:hypothetical protein
MVVGAVFRLGDRHAKCGALAGRREGDLDFSRFAQRAYASNFSETPALHNLWNRAAEGASPSTAREFGSGEL